MALMLLSTNFAHAQLETLVMPGDVVEGHAEYEQECSSCHRRFERGKQRELCLDCHEDVAADVQSSAGFHGRFEDARTGTCAACHTDHEGRDADIVGLDESNFDHAMTDFALLGRHADSACIDCHKPRTKHREAPAECNACHEAESPHAETLGDECGDCHVPSDWLEVEFDHDTTGYSLLGRHLEPTCLDCHADRTFKETPSTCYGCHAEDDAHNSLSGNECGNCHKPTGWDDTSFDHNRDTTFMLNGGHADQSCDACHSDDPFSDKLEIACVTCHLEDDNHNQHFGDACDSCHSTSAWAEVRFDHAIDTGHALNGAHSDAECSACHIEPIFETPLESDCLACHESDEPHDRSLGIRCLDCHNESTWQDDVFFDHDLTRFPLLGTHADTECEGCHESHVFGDAPETCIDCHRNDDSHQGRFGEACATCHNPVGWPQWSFDHDIQTDFRLEGAHRDVACETCHRQSLDVQSQLGGSCAGCHLSDDVHNGEFGRDCARCHSADSFREVRSIR